MSFSSIDKALEDYKAGKTVLIVDDEDRENEGDLCCAAEYVSPETINFMATHGRGLICLAMTETRLDELDLPLMVGSNTSLHKTGFCVSVDALKGVKTGISAKDRAHTISVMLASETRPEDLARPGHIFPLRAVKGGVLRRAGHTEASVDLARIAGLNPSAVICEVLDDDGTMARLPSLKAFALKHGMSIISVQDLIRYRMQNERFVKRQSETILPTPYGEFRLYAYENELDGQLHLAAAYGNWKSGDAVTVRVHSECLTGEVFRSLRCDCGEQLEMAFETIAGVGQGVLVYLRQEGRGIGLKHKLQAYALQDKGKDTVEANEALGFKADQRDYGVGAQILSDLGIHKIRVLTNNPRKLIGLEGFGIEIVDRLPLEVEPSDSNSEYLRTKKKKLGHLLTKV